MRNEQETKKNKRPAASGLALVLLLLLLALPVSAGVRFLLAGARDDVPVSAPAIAGSTLEATGSEPATPDPGVTGTEPDARASSLANSATLPATRNPSVQPAPSLQALNDGAASQLLDYTIKRLAQPALPYAELTLLVQVGLVDSLEVSGDGEPLDYTYDAERGTVLVTTEADNLRLVLHNPRGGADVGTITIAPLKDNHQWAWSHGFDDNVNLRPAIDLFRDYSWRATLFLIAKDVDDYRNEGWIADAPYLETLLAESWSLGNHTWDHSCAEDDSGAATVTRAQQRLEEIVARSPRPDYPVIAFAAPCFSPAYGTILAQLRSSGETALLFNESGNNYYIAIAPGAGPYAAGARQIVSFAPDITIGRSPAIELGTEEAMKEFEWVAAQAAAGRPLWFNTFSHGDKEETLAAVLAYLHDTYGPGGSNALWVAPSDEIYSYLRLRETTTITRNN